MDRQFARAIRAYLALAEHRATSEDPVGQGGGGGAGSNARDVRREPARSTKGQQYAHVFRMIEQHSLFDTVQARKVIKLLFGYLF